MRRRLLVSTCLIALASVIVLGLPLGFVGSALLRQRADMRLERRADAAALRLVRAEAQGRPLRFALVDDLLASDEAVRVTGDGHDVTLGTPGPGQKITVTSGDGGSLRVELIAPASVRDDDVGKVWLAVAGSGFAALLAAIVLATVQSRRLARPLERLAVRVEDIGEPGFDHRPVASSMPEIDHVQAAAIRADERITELVRREREFTANASHQLRSPLTGLRLRLEELRRLARDADSAAEADAALTQADRLAETIEHLETVARVADDLPGPVDVGALVVAHVDQEAWRSRYQQAHRPLAVHAPHGMTAHAHAESVRQITDVLLDNALVHGEGATDLALMADDGWVRLRVSDQGSRSAAGGVDVFTRGVGAGSGIGLAVARDLARRCGGDLRLAPGATTAFEALLPRE